MKIPRHIERNGFHAIDWRDERWLLPEFLKSFPETVIGKFLVNTCFDSGFLTLSESEKKDGWHMVERLAHSPRISDPSRIPHDQFDEWLIFDKPTRVEKFETMVNYYGFTPLDIDWDEEKLFWQQLVDLNPVSLIGENDGLYVVSRDEQLIEAILRTAP